MSNTKIGYARRVRLTYKRRQKKAAKLAKSQKDLLEKSNDKQTN